MEFLPQALAPLAHYNQFIIYVLVNSKTRQGKLDKLPIDYRTRQVANAHDMAIWLDATTAINIAREMGSQYGVGFVFTMNDPFFFLDIDDCLESSGTQWSPLSQSLLAALSGAAVEVSSSGRGLHIIGTGSTPPHVCRNAEHKLELYTSGRFVALTGIHASGDANKDCTPALSNIIAQYFPTSSNVADRFTWSTEPCAEWNGPANDDELINRALRSQSGRSAFGNAASFRDLYECNIEALSKAYPDSNRPYDESAADSALAQHLAFWTGNHCDRIERIMRRSALVRDKWDREDYLPRTIVGVCGRQKEWLCDKPPQDIVNTPQCQDTSLRPALVTGNTFLSIDQQCDIFTGCAYVADEHKILIPGGFLLNPERFTAMYGGYSMPLDHKNEKVTRNAYEAFMQSQAFRSVRVDGSCFRPDLKPGTIVEKDGQRLINVWWPIKTPRAKGDPDPFLKHIALLCPDKRDQMILICYLAAIIQFPGIKFQWCPLIQGVQGNGKTLLTRCVAYAIGDRYSHFPKSAEISNKFNDWLYAKIFIAIEDIYVPDARLEIMEAMKPMITSERQEIEAKGGVKVTRDICANFLINTNHKDGLKKTQSDRRFAPFYTAQQTVNDLKRDGMWGDYFPNLYTWLNKGGYAVVADFLQNFELPDEFNPVTQCKRAPNTSTTHAAVEQSLGSAEQEIIEAIEQNIQGFRGGYVSSMQLDRLLERIGMGRRIPRNKRKELMQGLGYEHHPALKDGRVDNPVMPDNGKPRLYINVNHPDMKLTSGPDVARAYEKANK